MWNSFAEKAKSLAANIDKQINDSVGMDDNGKPATAEAAATTPFHANPAYNHSVSSTSSNAAPSSVNSAAAPAQKIVSPNNAWDDFNDDFGDDFGAEKKAPAKAVATPPTSQGSKLALPAATKTAAAPVATPTMKQQQQPGPLKMADVPVKPSSNDVGGVASVTKAKLATLEKDDADAAPTENGWSAEDDDIDVDVEVDVDVDVDANEIDDAGAAAAAKSVDNKASEEAAKVPTESTKEPAVDPTPPTPTEDTAPAVPETEAAAKPSEAQEEEAPPSEAKVADDAVQSPIVAPTEQPQTKEATSTPAVQTEELPADDVDKEPIPETPAKSSSSAATLSVASNLFSSVTKAVGTPASVSQPEPSDSVRNLQPTTSSTGVALSSASSMFSSFSKAAPSLGSSFLQKADALITQAVENDDAPTDQLPQTAEASDHDFDVGDGDGGWDDDPDIDQIDSKDDATTSKDAATPSTQDAPTSNGKSPAEAAQPDTGLAIDKKSRAEAPAALSKSAPPMTPDTGFSNGGATTTFTDPSSTAMADISATANAEGDAALKKQIEELKTLVHLRENQLSNKAEQLTELQSMWETDEAELKRQIQNTKDEAKKRIQRAKERCEAAEAKLTAKAHQSSESSDKQAEIIAELRDEGQKLAIKQSEMEKIVRQTKTEVRTLSISLENETIERENAQEQVEELTAELKATKEALTSARKGESTAGKLENDLLEARSDAELKAAQILTLEQEIKELKAQTKDMKTTAQMSQKSAAIEAAKESKKLRREHNDIIADLEQKLRAKEKDAAASEDALQNEVSEMRKRWEDAVRRNDALSVDIEQSTAPLLRQLDSKERQQRARAKLWEETEISLRSALDEAVIKSESSNKELGELKSQVHRLEVVAGERDKAHNALRIRYEENLETTHALQKKMKVMEEEAERRQKDYLEMERLANEGVARVRSEMTQTVMDSEERYRSQIDRLESSLTTEREKKGQLEQQIQQLLDNAANTLMAAPVKTIREAKPKKLRKAEGQADILAGALVGLDDGNDEYNDDNDDDDDDDEDTAMNTVSSAGEQTGIASFAAHEQLTSKLKVAQVECKALRASLRESEKTREQLLEELVTERGAKEKLSSMDARVQELEQDNMEQAQEIQGLHSDIVDVKELYRNQLNMLLEEKAVAVMQPEAPNSPEGADNTPAPQAQEGDDNPDTAVVLEDGGQ